jgi:hypothetical protein
LIFNGCKGKKYLLNNKNFIKKFIIRLFFSKFVFYYAIMKKILFFVALCLTVSCRPHPQMEVEDTGKALLLKNSGRPVLQYNYAHVDPPEGVDPIFGRSGFIHPAWSPAGNVLTSIQPPDHRHHYGIWNPWTHLVYDSVLYDLWNLGERQGTVRAISIDTVFSGSEAGFHASLAHVIFTTEGEKTVMHETWKVKTRNAPEGFLWDFESVLQPSTPYPITLAKYHYAGFGYRATPEWNRDNCMMTSSEGLARPEINASRARWIYIEGDMPTGRSGLLFMAHPANHNSPEPLRIWDDVANNGRGDAFINFNPTQTADWTLEPEHTYTLRYRMLAFDGQMTAETANRLWNDFAASAN